MAKENKEIKCIGQIDFHDIQVGIYYDPLNLNKDYLSCSWRMRNPDSSYQGIIFWSYRDNKMSYPKDAVIPKQTDRDREILPKFIVTGKEEIDDRFMASVKSYLYLEYTRRNPIFKQDQG